MARRAVGRGWGGGGACRRGRAAVGGASNARAGKPICAPAAASTSTTRWRASCPAPPRSWTGAAGCRAARGAGQRRDCCQTALMELHAARPTRKHAAGGPSQRLPTHIQLLVAALGGHAGPGGGASSGQRPQKSRQPETGRRSFRQARARGGGSMTGKPTPMAAKTRREQHPCRRVTPSFEQPGLRGGVPRLDRPVQCQPLQHVGGTRVALSGTDDLCAVPAAQPPAYRRAPCGALPSCAVSGAPQVKGCSNPLSRRFRSPKDR